MRVLHIVKTSDGALWAARQAVVLCRLGIEVHVAVPMANGAVVPFWRNAGAIVHVVDLGLNVLRPCGVPAMCSAARRLVEEVRPDIIHSHFVNTTILLRLALGAKHPVPRVFQVPGPLHLEHVVPRRMEMCSAQSNDCWIGSSGCIVRHYTEAGIKPDRVFLSYYGAPVSAWERTGYLRMRLGIDDKAKIIGNINLIYPPKRVLGQRVGLKGHEDVIDAIGAVLQRRDDCVGVLIGSTFGTEDTRYEEQLRRRAELVGRGRIIMPGRFEGPDVERSWPDFDCAVHVPMSENCGGVVEPLAAGVPTIASRVGGLPEVVIDGVTGVTVPVHDQGALVSAILRVLDDPIPHKQMAATGRRLVEAMFDVKRTGEEVSRIYRYILGDGPRPPNFTRSAVLAEM